MAYLVLAATLLVSAQRISAEHGYTLAWLYGIIVAVSFGLAAAGKIGDDDALPSAAGHGRTAAVAAGGALFCAVFVWFCGRRQFGGFDHSVLIDVGWRLFQRQRPYRDFPCTLPVGFVLGAGDAFRLFGVSWSAIILFQAIFAALTFLWSLLLLRRLTRRWWLAGAMALACQAMTNLLTSYWWYNPITTTAAMLFFLSAAFFWREPQNRLANFSYAASLVLLAMMKPNIAGVLIGGATLVLLTSPVHRLRVLILSAVSFGVFAGWLGLHGLTVREIVNSYLSVSGRGFTLKQFLQDMSRRERAVSLAALALLLAPWLILLRPGVGRLAVRMRGVWLAAAAVAAGSFGFLTNGDNKLVDLPLLLLALWWAHAEFARTFAPGVSPAWLRAGFRWIVAALAILTITGLTAGWLRHRVRGIGPGLFFEAATSAASPQTAFFHGMTTGPIFLATEAETARALRENKPARVFFGPRMQWAYAAFHQPSPAGQPLWWAPGVSYPEARQDDWASRWADARHDLLIFKKDDFTLLPPRMLQIIARDYEPQPGWNELTVYTPRTPASAAPPSFPDR